MTILTDSTPEEIAKFQRERREKALRALEKRKAKKPKPKKDEPKTFGQKRHPEGDSRGGQFAPEGGGSEPVGDDGGSEPEGEKIGEGSTGDVVRVGDKVKKNATPQESAVYAAIGDVDGVAPGTTEGDKIVTPHYPYFIDTGKKGPKAPPAWLRANAGRMWRAMTALSDMGMEYGDPLQYGVTKGRAVDIVDFSNVSEADDALSTNLALLSDAFTVSGDETYAKAISSIGGIAGEFENAVSGEFDDFLSGQPEYDAAKRLVGEVGGTPQNVYFSQNARTIPGVAQLPHDGTAVIAASVEPLSEETLAEWDLVPVIVRDGKRSE